MEQLAKIDENKGTHGWPAFLVASALHTVLMMVEICMIFPEKSCTKRIVAIARIVPI